MRGTKDKEMFMTPTFPRLHVNDTERGGPRAPPRNKMALYEQLSIPSQRFNSASASRLPFPPSNGDVSSPSMGSSHGGGHGKRVFNQFRNSCATSAKAESLVSYSSSGAELGVTVDHEEHSMNARKDQSSNTTKPLSLSAKSNSFQSQRKSSWKKLGEENGFRVPRSAQSQFAVHHGTSQLGKDGKDQESGSYLSFSFAVQLQKASEKQTKGTGGVDVSSTLPSACQDAMKGSVSVPFIREKISLDESANLSEKFKSAKSLKRAHPSAYQEWQSSSKEIHKSLHDMNARLNKQLVTTPGNTILRDDLSLVSADKENACKVSSGSYPSLPLQHGNRNHNGLENGSNNAEDNICGSLPAGNSVKHDNFSETSVVDSVSALDLTPDDVVGVIGEKQFWNARRDIVNQQKVFAVQVFELHRLIKVQKLIAGSPHLLLGDKVFAGKASLKASLGKKLSDGHAVKHPSLVGKPIDCPEKPHPRTGFSDENVVGKPSLTSLNKDTNKEVNPQRSSYSSHSGSAPVIDMAGNAKPSQWFLPQPGNQWLVPVMSPSEGLVYKPYTGPCPPAAGFMAPAYGNCGPMNLTQKVGDFFNVAYGVPHPQGHGVLPGTHPFGQTNFPLYSMPVMKPPTAGSAVEPMNPFTGPQSRGSQSSVGDINSMIPCQNLYSASSQTSQAISPGFRKFQASKETDVQGRSSSNSSDRPEGDALPLFPTEPTVQASDQNSESNELRTPVIKVVPHNRRLATESAARIFQSIQEERKQY